MAPARADPRPARPAELRAVLLGGVHPRHPRTGQLRRRERVPRRAGPPPPGLGAARHLDRLGPVGGTQRDDPAPGRGRHPPHHRRGRRRDVQLRGARTVRRRPRRRPALHGGRRRHHPTGGRGAASRAVGDERRGAAHRRRNGPGIRDVRPATGRPAGAGAGGSRTRPGPPHGGGRPHARRRRTCGPGPGVQGTRLRLADRDGTAEPAGRRHRAQAVGVAGLRLPHPAGPRRARARRAVRIRRHRPGVRPPRRTAHHPVGPGGRRSGPPQARRPPPGAGGRGHRHREARGPAPEPETDDDSDIETATADEVFAILDQEFDDSAAPHGPQGGSAR
ncbi:hypothetical protein SGRI78S_06492 [Streptomyces griseus subsp. griseus]